MSDNLVIEMLRGIRGGQMEMQAELREQRARIAAIARTMAHIERDNAEHRAGINGRFDRILDRLERIERRLDLREA